MEIIGIACMGIGVIISLIYGIILLIAAFQESVLWGLGYLFVPFVALVFIFMHWEQTKKPFLMSLLSIPFFLLGVILMPDAATATH
jgi:hypothetical protein